MMQTRRSGREIPGVLCGMAGTILSIEHWSDAALATLSFALVVFWAYPVRSRALLARLVPFLIFAGITFAFGSLGEGTSLTGRSGGTGEAAVSRAGLAAARMILIGVASGWLGLYVGTTRMISLLAGLGKVGRRFGLDLSVPMLAMGVAIRFLPLVEEEARRLQMAWEARGAGLARRGLLRRIRYGSALTVPLMAAALRRAEALADAIEVRLGGSSLQGGDLWRTREGAESGRHREGPGLRRWIGLTAAWLLVALRVWRWVG